MEITLGICIIFLGGLIAGKISQFFKLPAITGYTLLGILIGPYIFNFLSDKVVQSSGIMSYIVLGVVAFCLGESFSLNFLKKLGKIVLWISILEAAMAWILVTITFYFLLGQPFYLSLILGAIASATAPAATLAIIRELKAKGTFTDILLSVVAIDDAWCLIIFAISLMVSKSIYNDIEISKLFPIIGRAFLDIFGALALGAILAAILAFFSRFIKREEEFLLYTLGFILLALSLSHWFKISLLLTCMSMGIVLTNIHSASYKFFESLKKIDILLYTTFFVLIGANFEIDIIQKEFLKCGVFIVGFMTSRWIGKILGAWLGGTISKAPEKVRKYLGFALVPQAGVALGISMIAKVEFPEVGNFILTIIIAKTILNELLGPPCSRYAIIKSGDAEEYKEKQEINEKTESNENKS